MDYPRPPRVEPCVGRVRVEHAGVTIADSTRAKRVLETTHPPTIYIPREDLNAGAFKPAASKRQTICEWKGAADYYDVEVRGRRSENAAWHYPEPVTAYAELADHVAIYPGRVDACYIDGERVTPEQGDFYGGWITGEIELD